MPVIESTRPWDAEHYLLNYNVSRSKVPLSDSDDELMEVSPQQESSIADAESVTIDTSDNETHFIISTVLW